MAKGYHRLRRQSSDPILGRKFSETNSNSYSVPSSTRVNINMLRRGLTLPIHDMAIPIYTDPSPSDDVEVGGRVLFQHFIQQELVHSGFSDEILEVENPPEDTFRDVGPSMLHGEGDVAARAESPAFLSTPDGYKSAQFIQLGENIRNIADQFARSHQRREIQDLADNVDLSEISYETFHHVLREVFAKGVDKFRIVSLFYFCSDILIRCVKNELHKLGSKLFFWALQFIIQKVCKWVQDHGGWEKVFSRVYNLVYCATVTAACFVVIGCGIIYIKKNI